MCAKLVYQLSSIVLVRSQLYAVRIQPQSREWMLFGHQSAEYGHQRVLKELDAQPILAMNLRLGKAVVLVRHYL